MEGLHRSSPSPDLIFLPPSGVSNIFLRDIPSHSVSKAVNSEATTVRSDETSMV